MSFVDFSSFYNFNEYLPVARCVRFNITSDDIRSEVSMVDLCSVAETDCTPGLQSRLCDSLAMTSEVNIKMHGAGRIDIQIVAPVRSDADVEAMWDVATRLSQDISIGMWDAGQLDRGHFEQPDDPERLPF